MWIMMTGGFVSIVRKDCARDELLVRARRREDIELLFPNAEVRSGVGTDYQFRAVVAEAEVRRVIATEIANIDYGNFKSATRDSVLHDAYMRVWGAMNEIARAGRRLVADEQRALF